MVLAAIHWSCWTKWNARIFLKISCSFASVAQKGIYLFHDWSILCSEKVLPGFAKLAGKIRSITFYDLEVTWILYPDLFFSWLWQCCCFHCWFRWIIQAAVILFCSICTDSCFLSCCPSIRLWWSGGFLLLVTFGILVLWPFISSLLENMMENFAALWSSTGPFFLPHSDALRCFFFWDSFCLQPWSAFSLESLRSSSFHFL